MKSNITTSVQNKEAEGLKTGSTNELNFYNEVIKKSDMKLYSFLAIVALFCLTLLTLITSSFGPSNTKYLDCLIITFFTLGFISLTVFLTAYYKLKNLIRTSPSLIMRQMIKYL